MNMYVELARRLATSSDALKPWDVTHPLGYPAFLSFLMGSDGSFGRAVIVHLVVSCLVPLAGGLLGVATFGRRTGLLAMAFASLYFPFIEYGALFLSEIHFIFCFALAFTALFAARNVEGRQSSLVLSFIAGAVLSMAIAFKSVALPAALAFFFVDAVAILLARTPGGAPRALWAALRPWLLRVVYTGVAAIPLLSVLARVCTRANGRFCITGNKMGADFLLGHYGRIADIAWGAEQGHGFAFGSPSSYLRHYDVHKQVPFPMTDVAANAHEAWKWIFKHPFEALVLSLDH